MRTIAKLSVVLCAVVALTLPTARDADAQTLTAPPLLVAPGAEKPIALQSMAIDVDTVGGLARTTLDLVFHNPNARLLEGNLQFPLQPGQQVSGFALDIDGAMRPAVAVPKARGQQVFEAIERRGVDPALLEQTAGNQFRLRIYPIPANGTRRVRIAIDEAMTHGGDGWLLRLPVAIASGLATIRLHVAADEGTATAAPVFEGAYGAPPFVRGRQGFDAVIGRRQFDARSGLALRIADAVAATHVHTQSRDDGHYFVADVPFAGTATPRTLPRTIGLLWDSSGSSRTRDIDSELAVLDGYFKAVRNTDVRLVRLRDVGDAPQSFRVSDGDWSMLKQALRDTAYDGASALADWTAPTDVQELLLVSDGHRNYGLRSALPTLRAGQRLYTLDSGGAASDGARLTAWAEANGGRHVAWQGSAGVAGAIDALLRDAPRIVALDGVGVADLTQASAFASQGRLRIAGRLTEPQGRVTITVQDAGAVRTIVVPIAMQPVDNALVGSLWAADRIRALGMHAETNRAAIARLGQQFGLVNAETSLLVLDDIADYVRYDIAPPPELRAAVATLRETQGKRRDDDRRTHLDAVADAFADEVQWWNTAWPKGKPPVVSVVARNSRYAPVGMVAPAPPAPMSMPPMPMESSANDTVSAIAAPIASEAATSLDSVEVTRSRREQEVGATSPASTTATIRLQPWQPDSPYARRLRAADGGRVYALYLDERDSHAGSTAFYLDVADILFEKHQPALALRVLSNLAELELGNRHVLRVLAYRLLQAKQPALALPLLVDVQRLAEEEPQGFRDLGLAYAALGRNQEAIDALNEVVVREWDGRFDGVALIALAELNAIVARSPTPLDTSRIDRRLLRNLPLDLRVVLGWDSDNSDMDLWVTDPNGEKAYYSNPATYQGGRMSDDFTGGYGPESFSLRDAKPGKYIVQANFFGDRQQIVTGATTLQLTFTTGFGTSRQREQTVSMRLKDAKETILVGEFEVR